LREKRTLRLFTNRELRTRFGLMRNEVNGERRRPYNGEIYDLYFSLILFR
jgi:hypothetical protein